MAFATSSKERFNASRVWRSLSPKEISVVSVCSTIVFIDIKIEK